MRTTLVTFLLATMASAQVTASSGDGSRRDLSTFEAWAHAGFTESITKGVQPFGFGAGAGFGTTLSIPVYLHATITKFVGSSASAGGASSAYSASYSAWALALGVAWTWAPIEWLSIRPGVVLNGALVSGRTEVNGATLESTERLFSLGPKILILAAPTPAFLVGIEAEARTIPKQLFAPIGAVSLIAGVRF